MASLDRRSTEQPRTLHIYYAYYRYEEYETCCCSADRGASASPLVSAAAAKYNPQSAELSDYIGSAKYRKCGSGQPDWLYICSRNHTCEPDYNIIAIGSCTLRTEYNNVMYDPVFRCFREALKRLLSECFDNIDNLTRAGQISCFIILFIEMPVAIIVI